MTLKRFRAKVQWLKKQKEEKRRAAQILKFLEQETEFSKKDEHFFKEKTRTGRPPTKEEWWKMGGLPTDNAELRLVMQLIKNIPALKLKDKVQKKLRDEFEIRQSRT